VFYVGIFGMIGMISSLATKFPFSYWLSTQVSIGSICDPYFIIFGVGYSVQPYGDGPCILWKLFTLGNSEYMCISRCRG
jgi:hypothetical protein